MDDAGSDLKLNDILLAEFAYAQACAMQANEDRARVTSYFLAAAGSVAVAILGLEADQASPQGSAWGFAGIFGLFALLTWAGHTTISQLVALRLAWRKSCQAMNHIKCQYVGGNQEKMEKTFEWRDDTLPPAFKRTSVSCQLAKLVAVIMGLSAATATMFAQWALWGADAAGSVFGWATAFFGLAVFDGALGSVVSAMVVGLLVLTLAWRRYVTALKRADIAEALHPPA